MRPNYSIEDLIRMYSRIVPTAFSGHKKYDPRITAKQRDTLQKSEFNSYSSTIFIQHIEALTPLIEAKH